MERDSLSRSTLIATDALDLSRRRMASKAPAGRTPALLWSAPAECNDDGALDPLRTALETPGSSALRSPNPKRRGATLPAALQNACATILRAVRISKSSFAIRKVEPARPERSSVTRERPPKPLHAHPSIGVRCRCGNSSAAHGRVRAGAAGSRGDRKSLRRFPPPCARNHP